MRRRILYVWRLIQVLRHVIREQDNLLSYAVEEDPDELGYYLVRK